MQLWHSPVFICILQMFHKFFTHFPFTYLIIPRYKWFSSWWLATQGPLKKWTEHSQELHLLKIHSRRAPITPRDYMDGVWFFWPWAFIILISSYQDLSNEGQKLFWVHWNLFFKLREHGHFWINFRFWLVWVELRKSKAMSSMNFLQRHEKYQIGLCPQLLYA